MRGLRRRRHSVLCDFCADAPPVTTRSQHAAEVGEWLHGGGHGDGAIAARVVDTLRAGGMVPGQSKQSGGWKGEERGGKGERG